MAAKIGPFSKTTIELSELSYSDVFVVTLRDRIVPPVSVETVIVRDRNKYKRSKKDDEYRERLNRSRSLRSIHGNFYRSNGSSTSNTHSRSLSLMRSFERINSPSVSRSYERSAAVRSSSSRNRSSNSTTKRSSNNRSSSSERTNRN